MSLKANIKIVSFPEWTIVTNGFGIVLHYKIKRHQYVKTKFIYSYILFMVFCLLRHVLQVCECEWSNKLRQITDMQQKPGSFLTSMNMYIFQYYTCILAYFNIIHKLACNTHVLLSITEYTSNGRGTNLSFYKFLL